MLYRSPRPVVRALMFTLLISAYVLRPTHHALSATVDLALDANSISFSEEKLYAGDVIRIYARVNNLGDTDASAYVLFYQGGLLIAKSQPVSLLAHGNPDDVYVDFAVPTGTFNIRAVIQGSSPQDQNPANDSAMTPLFLPIVDADRDGVVDEDDTCVNDANADQRDTDSDGIGDVCDADDDGDGVADSNDAYPLDSSKSSDPAPIVVQAPVTPSVPTVSEPVASESPAVSEPVAATNTQTDASSDTPSSPNAGSSGAFNLQSSISHLTTSPHARFTWRQTDWRTYEFTLAQQPEDGVQFSWDFGDGTTSVQPQILHAFSGPGAYTVTLAIVDEQGNVLSDAQTFDITFFHLDNPQVVGLILLLFIALFSFSYAFIKLRHPYDQGIAHK